MESIRTPQGLANAIAKLYWISSGSEMPTEPFTTQEARALLDKLNEGITGKGTQDRRYSEPYDH